ncbi:MAG: hypothetical protein K0R46_827 [Herbinix sp.]|jgi:hypothetical protein|nr:hypothetical protein [Herbinix sp.]
MKPKKIRNIFRKISLVLLIVVFFSEAIADFSTTPVKAQEENTITNFSTDDPIVEASVESRLPSNPTQSKQAELLGFSTEQPSRISPNGKEVDKNKNPLGPDTVVVNRTYQLAYTYEANNKDQLGVYNNPIGADRISIKTNRISSNTSANSGKLDALHKNIIAVDTDGNGTQEVANIAYEYIPSSKVYSLVLYISDFNNLTGNGEPTTSKFNTISLMKDYPNNDLTFANDAIKCASGDFDQDGIDEIAIATGSEVFLCKATMSNCKVISSTKYSSSVGDMKALDSDKDGFPELLVTKDSSDHQPSTLMIYNGTNLSSPDYSIELALGNSEFTTATVDVGDLLGDGDDTIVIGGKSTLKKGKSTTIIGLITYIKYYPETESYDETLTKIYSMLTDSKTSFKAVLSSFDVKCVSLATPVPGTPEAVILGGYIFNYDPLNDIFKRQTINTYSNNSTKDYSLGASGPMPGNSSKKAEDNITNVNHDEDETYILETLVGNFDGNGSGKEQIIMLHYNDWYDKKLVYITQCYMNEDGTITSNLNQVSQITKKDAYNYPSISTVDIYNHGTKLRFLSSRSSFVYSNPVVTAVLGASPYYQELEDITVALGNVDTTYGTGSESETSTTNGVSVSAGVSFGYENSFSILGVELFSIAFETSVTRSLSTDWSRASSVSKEIAYTNYYTDDAVILTVVPYDVYVYEATVWNSETKKYETGEIVMQIPYTPMTTMMTVENYNKAAETIPKAPIITLDVLDHTVGDPRSYPRSSKGLSNVSNRDVLLAGSNDDNSFIGCGIGNSSVEQSITSTSTTGKSFEYEESFDVSFRISIGGVTGGTSAGAGHSHNLSITSSKNTTRSGSVASVPSSYSQYQFSWALVAYNYNLKAGDSFQSCTVISYICKPIGNDYPPKVPKNLKVSSQDLNSTKLRWDSADGSAGYNIMRSTSMDGSYTIVASVDGKNTNIFNDATIERNQDYFYQIKAFNSKLARPTELLKVSSLNVTDIRIKTQPKLSYQEYDSLDLSALVVSLVLNNDTTVNVAYPDFAEYNISTSLDHGIELDSTNTGIPITVKYVPNYASTNTNSLNIKAYNPYPIELTVHFTVGSSEDAIVLVPGKQLKASITMENTISSNLPVVVTLALYDNMGTMVQYTVTTKTVAANKSANCSNTLTLPSNIDGYTAKVFVWDGTSLSSSSLTPLAEVIQIPTN